jgi:succinate dehydrogenase / fumarate reductase cytochrome b subunit
MSSGSVKLRPKNLSLRALICEIRLPLPGWVSILHRLSGALLVFPFATWLLFMLDASLTSERDFEHMRGYLDLVPVKTGIVLFIWAFCHHFCAGVRFLLLDLNRGVGLKAARISSVAVLLLGIGLTGLLAWRLW